MTLIAPMVYLALVTWAIIKKQSAMDDSTLDRGRSRSESGFVRWRGSDLARNRLKRCFTLNVFRFAR